MKLLTRLLHYQLSLCVGLCVLITNHTAAGVEWDIRPVMAADQTDEMTQRGQLPAYQVSFRKDGVIEIMDDAQGNCRGMVLLGQVWQVPSPFSPSLSIQLRYQTYCDLNQKGKPRSGQARLLLFSLEGWNQLAKEAAQAKKADLNIANPQILHSQSIHNSNEDVTEWREWNSGPLPTSLRALAGKQIVAAIVWGCMHPGVKEWAKFSNWQIISETAVDRDWKLLNSLNFERPELAQVKTAVLRQDLPAARQALVNHFKTRTKPVPIMIPPSATARKTANEICDKVFRMVGCPPTKIGPDIKWNEDPHDYDQWAIALNRHSHWSTLGQVYAATRDEKYAREFTMQLNSWITTMPVHIGRSFIEGPYFETGRSPLSLDAGIRMAQTWWRTYEFFKQSPSFDSDSQFRMIQSFVDHAYYLMDRRAYRPESNWGAMETAGLFTLAVMLPEFKESELWLRTAQARLMECRNAQVYPDGAQIELATGYHWVTADNFLTALELSRLNGIKLPDGFESGLEKMFEYFVALYMPDGRMPSLNDGSWGTVAKNLARGWELFPSRSDFQYLSTGRKQGKAPAQTSWDMPYAGWHIMRSGWGMDDSYLLFETGPYGAGHQHEDMLNLIVHAGRKTILTEGGNYSYDQSDWRKYVLSTRAHNTIRVDGQDQNRKKRKETFVMRKPADACWHSDEKLDYAQGIYNFGYGSNNATRVTHSRQVLFVKPDYWVVVDRLAPQDNTAHQYEALFHLDAENVELTTNQISVAEGKTGFRILAASDAELATTIVKGQKQPEVQGWLPTGEHNKLRPIPTATYRWKSQPPSTTVFVLVPQKTNSNWPATGLKKLANLQFEITRTDGGKDILTVSSGTSLKFQRHDQPNEPVMLGKP
jgi:hypothetical protein